MIITETITINGRDFKRTYSDEGCMIERNGVRYNEAIDPIDTERVYAETDVKFESIYDEYSEAGKILLGVME